MEELLIYWSLFSIGVFIALLGGLFFIGVAQDKIPDLPLFLLAGMVTALIIPFSYYGLGSVDIYPPALNTTDPAENQSIEVVQLQEQHALLQEKLKNPENLTLSQLSSITSDVLNISSEIGSRAKEQEIIISKLREDIELEKKKADEAKKVASQIQAITKDQLEAVKLLITEDAKEESKRSFYFGLLFSFQIGFIASLMASSVWRRFAAEVKKETKKASS